MRRAAAIVALALVSAPAGAQDFAGPAPAALSRGTLGFLERALPPEGSDPRLETLATRVHGLSDLDGVSLALGGGWRALRVAAGCSRVGVPGIGWESAGFAAGTALATGGAAVRVLVRRDVREPGAPAPDVGIEAGGGAWVRAGRARLWAASPQAARSGAAPPLLRGLEAGGDFAFAGVTLWIAHAARAFAGAPRTRTVGVALTGDAFALWVEARDHPRRAGLGLRGQRGPVGIAAVVESHPVLAETVRIAVEFAPFGSGR